MLNLMLKLILVTVVSSSENIGVMVSYGSS